MSKKKNAQKGGKKAEGEPKDIPSIFEDLRTKQIPELEPDLSQPIEHIMKENTEFSVLTDRLQFIITRLEEDNSRLQTIGTRVEKKIAAAQTAKMAAINRAVEERAAEKQKKDA